jgi:hypothetical protein
MYLSGLDNALFTKSTIMGHTPPYIRNLPAPTSVFGELGSLILMGNRVSSFEQKSIFFTQLKQNSVFLSRHLRIQSADFFYIFLLFSSWYENVTVVLARDPPDPAGSLPCPLAASVLPLSQRPPPAYFLSPSPSLSVVPCPTRAFCLSVAAAQTYARCLDRHLQDLRRRRALARYASCLDRRLSSVPAVRNGAPKPKLSVLGSGLI